MTRLVGARLCLLLLALPRPAAAQAPAVDDETRNRARELGQDGVSAYQAAQYDRALTLLARAYALVPAPTIGLYHARALSRLGRLVEAVERYEMVKHTHLGADAPEAFRDAVSVAEKEGEQVRARIPRLKLHVTGPGASSQSLQVELDGKPYPKALLDVEGTLDPGSHLIAARVPGTSSGEQKLFVDEQKRYVVSVNLMPLGATSGTDPADPSALSGDSRSSEGISQRTWSYVAFGVGGAGLAVGVGAGLTARAKKSDLDAQCPDNRCPPSAEPDHDAFKRWNTISIVGYGAGIAGLITGGVLFATAPERPRAGTVSAWVGPTSAGVFGSF